MPYIPILPIVVLILSLALMIYCLRDLSKRLRTRYLTKTYWTVLVIVGSLLGQFAYLALEVLSTDS